MRRGPPPGGVVGGPVAGAEPLRQRTPLTLRVSVLDRCRYRCAYCRPGVIAPFLAHDDCLSTADYARLAPCFAALGVNKVRFTGGEPLLRPELPDIVRVFRAHVADGPLSLTTNGQLLDRKLDSLVEAGLDGATVHVDSLRPARYRELMGDGDVDLIVGALLRAKERLAEVKVNVVVQRGKNDDELGDFLELSRRTGIQVRFIELMNTGSNVAYTNQTFFRGREIVARLHDLAGATAIGRTRPSDPAALYRTDDGLVFGVIASDTEPFCADCNRLRLTARGDLRGCLYQGTGLDLREAMRRSDEELRAQLFRATVEKRSHHPDVVPVGRVRFSMAQTGG